MSVKTIIRGMAGGVALLAISSPARADTAVLAGGCFWGMEAVFEHVKGVSDVVSGYAGGTAANARYEAADSGHAEAVRITYDPRQVSYAQLLQIFFAVAHDPTQLDRQGPDVGRSYRSAIFPQNAAQAAQAKTFIARLNASHAYKSPIATGIERGGFWPAESYHQDFARKNPYHPYIVVNDRPKVAALKRRYPALYRG
jgi:peptide-methionine (S)-S-oxide reductase